MAQLDADRSGLTLQQSNLVFKHAGSSGIDEPKLKVQRNIDVWVSLSLKHSAIGMSTHRPGNPHEEYSNCHPSHPIILVGYAWFIRILIQLYEFDTPRKFNSKHP